MSTTTKTHRPSNTTGDAILCRKGRLVAGRLVGWHCPCCGQKMNSGACRHTGLQADHAIPFAMIGNVLEDNIIPLCGDCNSLKGARSIYDLEWIEERLYRARKRVTNRYAAKQLAADVSRELDILRLALPAALRTKGIYK